MLVYPDHIQGTIGGGALEWHAMTAARRMLANNQCTTTETVPLGPTLGQCCGGSVKLRYDLNQPFKAAHGRPVWIYGAGHVGRQVAAVMTELPDCDVTLIDVAADRFPDQLPNGVTPLVAADPALIVRHAPDATEHLIMTYSHDVDLALCHAILSRPFQSVGLIGSATKRARFRKRLADLGHSPRTIELITCPIGDPSLGKHPMQIAIGVATAMITPAMAAPREIAS